jgi:hypothetical protein
MGVLKVAVSLLTELPVIFSPPGTARPTQLFALFQALSAGAFVQVWLAAPAFKTPRRDAAKPIAARLLMRVPGPADFWGDEYFGQVGFGLIIDLVVLVKLKPR